VRYQGVKKKTDLSRRKKRKENVKEQNQCRFCRAKVKYIDYKDLDVLSKLLTHRGKIFSRKRSGNCASCQRKVRLAIKRARFMALLPFTS
jgi:small subunit ribosomal protein S18